MDEEKAAARAWPSLAPATPLADMALRQAVMTLGAELAAVQARLAALEAAAPATESAPERRASRVTGRAPLPEGTLVPAIAPAVTVTTVSPTQRPGWRDWGQAILVVALLLVVFTWLLRPQGGYEATDQPAVPTTTAPTAGTVAGAVGAPGAAQPTRGTRCAEMAREVCVGNAGRPATPAACRAPVGAAGEACVPDTVAAAPPVTTAASMRWTIALEATPLCTWDNPAITCSLDPPRTTMTIVIQAGDEVEWRVRAGLYTVTFPAAGTSAPPLYLPAADAAGVLNPLAADPQGGMVYDGTALVGSGVLDEHTPPYRLTFPQPGHYTYVDLEHPGLVSDIIVLPAAGAAATP